MCSSAIRSSSSIVNPGSSTSAQSASVSATSAPARAIASISCDDLRMITISRPSLQRGKRLLDLVEDLVDRTSGMDADGVAVARAVVLDERRRLGVVQLEPPRDRLGRVVGAVLLGCALEHPLEQLLAVGNLELEDDVDRAA